MGRGRIEGSAGDNAFSKWSACSGRLTYEGGTSKPLVSEHQKDRLRQRFIKENSRALELRGTISPLNRMWGAGFPLVLIAPLISRSSESQITYFILSRSIPRYNDNYRVVTRQRRRCSVHSQGKTGISETYYRKKSAVPAWKVITSVLF